MRLLGAAQAQTIGTATTDLNLRSGPGPEQPVIGFIKARQKANILGCIEGSLWCQVNFRGKTGWAYSQYMSLQAGGGRIVVREPANLADVPVVSYDALGYRDADLSRRRGAARRGDHRQRGRAMAARVPARSAHRGRRSMCVQPVSTPPRPRRVGQYVAANTRQLVLLSRAMSWSAPACRRP